jgi:hypothetical protein
MRAYDHQGDQAMPHHNFIQHLLGNLPIGMPKHLSAKFIESESSGRILLQESPLAGYQYHRASGIWPFLQIGAALRLHREPGNPYDPNAIAVWYLNEHLGYVPRRENRTLAQMMDRGERLEARIVRLREDDNPWRRIRFRVDLKPERF